MDTKPKFADRVAKLREAAQLLKEVADTVMLEVIHMEAAEKRFSERKASSHFRNYRQAEAAR